MKNIRSYNNEFKTEAVKLADELGSAVEAAKQLGIPSANIYQWRKRYSMTPVESLNSKDATVASMYAENQRLKQEVTQLKKVNYILKSAAAFFSQDHLK